MGKAIQDYQELITKRVATEGGQSVEHKRIPDHLRQQSKMNITSLIHGSFGFVLEEDNANQLDMFETPTRKALGFITDLLQEVADADGRIFEAKLDNLDAPIFQALKNFISTLHKAGSTLRVAEERREIKLDTSSVDRAFNRVAHVNIEENEDVVHGELLGLVPIQRRFDFRPSDVHEVIQGRVAATLSAEYLNRIEKEGLIAGGLWRATIRTKNVRHPDRRHTSVSRILIDLVRL
ncbi:hypothetical protein J2D73_20200 [Acetobacter sacchari]|uniref:Uncharacterized protein n=1 Tax=Acetobacter sacchari TaxID=2661687 RepID=A0ABS3M1M4_9PROT|nr:hypothetical protein [Acetobacter sacchari]MBO1362102.1 hypothetical protein [Acetobacter sacchari]